MKQICNYFLLLAVALFLMTVGISCKAKDPPLKEYTEFYQAILDGEYKTVQQLLRKYPRLISWEFNFGGYQGDSLITAILTGDSKMIDLLLKAGAEPNYYDNNGTTPLMTAIYHEEVQIVSQLIEAGADVDQKTKDGTTPLHIVSEKYNLEITDIIFAATKQIDEKKDGGFTPLTVALANYHNKLAFRLIQAGADLEKALNSAPHIIPEYVMNDNREMLEYFWEKDLIDPYVMYEHNNLFHYACWQNNINFVKELLARGLWDSTPNPAGDTPLDLAREFGNQEIIDLVKAAGFKD